MRSLLQNVWVLLALCAVPAVAQNDVFRLESVNGAAGAPIDMRVYIQDIAGNTIDSGANPLVGFFNFNMKLSFDPALVDSVEFIRAGLTESTTPFLFINNSNPDTGIAQLVCSYTPNRLPINLGQPSPGDVVANLRITPSAAAAGQTITFNFDDTDTNLAGRAGFPVLRVSAGNLNLQLGSVQVGGTPVLPVINSFTASPSNILQSGSSTLAWSVSGADTIGIDQGVGIVSASGNQVVSPASTTTYTLTATNAVGSVMQSVTVTVDPLPLPSIDSFTASPTSIIDGNMSALSWTVSGADTVAIDQGIGSVSASGSQNVSPSATTTYTITATNVSGSVQDTVTVNVTAQPLPTISDFAASPQTINPGGSSTLSWIVNGADSVSISPGFPNVASSGNVNVTPTDTTTYTLTATNSSGSVTRTATVTVVPPELPTISSFTGSPQTITEGSASTLSWNVSNATSVSINAGIGSVATVASTNVTPATTTTYTLTATNSAGSVNAQVTVTVNPLPAPIVNSFSVSPQTIGNGQSAALSWNVSNADTVTIDQGIGNVAASGSLNVAPAVTTTYTITATNAAGSDTATTTLTFSNQDPPVINSFTVNPTTIIPGNTATLAWNVSNADNVTLTGFGSVGSNGSRQASPSETTVYVLRATNSAGAVEEIVTLTVTEAPVPVINEYKIEPAEIVAGGSATLSWDIDDADTVDIGGGIGRVSSTGSRTVNPSETTEYPMLASNAAGNATATVTLTVLPAVEIQSFQASSTGIVAGESVQLSWTTVNATTVRINGLAVNTSGSQTFQPTQNTIYTLTAEGPGNQSISQQLSVDVEQLALQLNTTSINLADNDNDANIILSANSSQPINWQTGNLPAWLDISAAAGTVSDGNATTLTLTVNRDWFYPGRQVQTAIQFSSPGIDPVTLNFSAGRPLRDDETYLYYPLLWADATYQTDFNAINLSDNTVIATRQIFLADGSLAQPADAITLGPLANQSWMVDNLVTQTGWAVVTFSATGVNPSAPDAAGMANIRSRDNEELFTLSAVTPPTNFLYVPHIAADTANFFTLSSVVNLDSEGRSLDLASGNQPNFPIAGANPGGQTVFEYSEVMGGEITGPGWGELQFTPNGLADTVGAEVFGLTEATGARQTVGVGLNQADNNELFVPHIAADTVNFWTGVVVINLDGQPATVTFEPYNQAGELIDGGFEETFQSGEKRTYLVLGERLDFGQGAAWVRVSSNGPLTGYLLFGNPATAGADQFAGFESVRTLSNRLAFPHTEDAVNSGFSGISLIHPGGQAANLTIRLVAADGTVKETNASLTLDPKTKLVDLAANLFETSIAPGDIVLVESSENLAGFLLYGAGSKTLGALAAWPY